MRVNYALYIILLLMIILSHPLMAFIALMRRNHRFCYEQTVKWMNDSNITSISVHNTFTKESELCPYLELVNKYPNWNAAVIVVERRRENANSIHNVPTKTILRQEKNLLNSLRI